MALNVIIIITPPHYILYSEQETKVRLEQERADSAEQKLHEAQEEISQLSAELKQYRDSHLDLSSHKSNKKTSKGNRSKGDKKKSSNT